VLQLPLLLITLSLPAVVVVVAYSEDPVLVLVVFVARLLVQAVVGLLKLLYLF
jgi:hypothetical protein